MRRVLVAGNWKMHKTPSEARVWFAELKRLLPPLQSEAAVLPAFPILPVAKEVLAETQVGYGAQDVSAHKEGAYTGEVSARMLSDLGCRYAIVGHSERRRYHGETDALVAEKAKRLLEEGITPILCVGEPLEVREKGEAVPYTLRQLRGSLEGVEPPGPEALVIAYEPVWAIGTGKNATPEDAEAMHQAIRKALSERYGRPSRAGFASSTEEASTPRTSPTSSPCPTWTGGSWAGRAWSWKASSPSSGSRVREVPGWSPPAPPCESAGPGLGPGPHSAPPWRQPRHRRSPRAGPGTGPRNKSPGPRTSKMAPWPWISRQAPWLLSSASWRRAGTGRRKPSSKLPKKASQRPSAWGRTWRSGRPSWRGYPPRIPAAPSPGPGWQGSGGSGALEPRPRRQAAGDEALGKDPRAPEEVKEKPQEPHA